MKKTKLTKDLPTYELDQNVVHSRGRRSSESSSTSSKSAFPIPLHRHKKNDKITGSLSSLDESDSSRYTPKSHLPRNPPRRYPTRRSYTPLSINDISYNNNSDVLSGSEGSFASESSVRTSKSSNVDDDVSHSRRSFPEKEAYSIYYIKNLSKKPPHFLIKLLNSQKDDFKHFFKSPMKLEHMPSVLDFVLKVCSIDYECAKQDLLEVMLGSKEFIQNVSRFIENVIDYSQRESEISKNIDAVVLFCKEVTGYVPDENLVIFDSLLLKTIGILNEIDGLPKDHIKVVNLCKHLVSQKLELVQDELITYKSLSVFPSKEELLNENIDLNPNIVKGPYTNVEHYIDVQFKLLKEDYLSGLRTGINLYLKSLKEKKRTKNLDIFVYNVTYLGVGDDNDPSKKVLHIFEVNKKQLQHVQWDTSKRLIHGSLLFFSNDNFENLFMGVLDDRKGFQNASDKKDGTITVAMVGKQVKLQKYTTFVMIESRVFFEPYFQVMTALKSMHPQKFPLEKYIVHANSKQEWPKYLSENTSYIIGGKEVSLNKFHTWPEGETLGLNKSQLNALHGALTSEFIVIQGPPGTGKTYLGIKILQILLENKEHWSDGGKSPIFVACYRNNAVDQIMNSLREGRRLVRLGGRSSSEELKDCNLKNTVGHMRDPIMFLQMNELKDELREIKCRISELEKCKSFVFEKQGILNVSVFGKILTSRQNAYFSSSQNCYEDWLLSGDEEMYMPDDGFQENDIIKRILKSKSLLSSEHPFIFLSITSLLKELDGLEFSIQLLYESELSTFEVNQQMSELLIHYNEKSYTLNKLLNRLTITQSETPLEVLLNSDLASLSCNERWTLYNYWANEFFNSCEISIEQLIDNHDIKLLDFLTKRDLNDGENLRKAQVDIIGATTTGAARLNKLLEVAKPKIVLIEEAAEVLEAHSIASLTEHCEHLILIGDHKQLKPSPASHVCAVKHHMDVSLFERMINNGMECFTLSVQHRMRSEISSLVVPLIYPSLTNHESVEKYPDLKGMKKNLYFVDHREPEDLLIDNDSHQNTHEAHLALAIAEYIMKQGYEAKQVTVLTAYGAQLLYLKSIKKHYPLLEEVDIQVIDNFQGEENEIIILSLVRSNSSTIGFLSKENRVCVALTRAKIGFIMIGNMESLQKNAFVWKEMKKTLENQSALGEYLPLRCEIHKRITKVKNCKDFLPLAYGGCTDACEKKLDCGHTCLSMCHGMDIEHCKQFSCRQKCLRIRNCGVHNCEAECGIDCPPCNVKIPTKLDCGHDGFKICAGEVLSCKEPCLVKLQCDHQCPKKCHYKDKNHSEVECTAICDKPNERCPFRHRCPKKCIEECGECDLDTVITLDCGHISKGVCSIVRETDCEVPVDKDLVCGHTVKASCSLPASEVVCTDMKKVTLPCKHEVSVPCTTKQKDIECDTIIEKSLPCGHKATTSCSKPENDIECTEVLDKTLPCGHICKSVPCSTPVEDLICIEPMEKELKCGHALTVECFNSKSKNQCLLRCKLVLSCGHKCSSFCSEPCPPCHVKVEIEDVCGHTRKVPCSKSKDASKMSFEEIVALDRADDCKHPCNQTLPCNHTCQGTCGKCMQGRVHTVCNAVCGKQLICSHKCKSKCWNDLHSCKEKCLNECKHLQCRRLCGEICQKCEKPCEWACDHFHCSRKCWEICDRPPCELPCPFSLQCGHPCVGFCGEPCPPICLICSSSDKVLTHERYILLEDCGHVISHKVALNLIKSTVGIMICPECNNAVVKTNFLRSYSKTFFSKYSKAKTATPKVDRKAILLDFKNNFKILNEVLRNKYEDCTFLNKLLRNLLNRTTPIILNKGFDENQLSLKTLLFICFYVTEALKLSKVNEMNAEKNMLLLKRINHLASYLLSRENRKISPAEMKMFFQELVRLRYIIDLVILIQEQNLKPESSEVIPLRHAMATAFSFKEFSSEEQSSLKASLQELKKYFFTNHQLLSSQDYDFKKITDFFVKYCPLTYHLGDWYECKKGHFYYSEKKVEKNNCLICFNPKQPLFLA